tara:strand:+ start:5957 stop:6199 length:243 start_codon:yes stop_codon:yes gene_type:complete
MINPKDKPEEKLPPRKHVNRRRMAWIALIAMLIVTGLMMFSVDETRLDKLSDMTTWFYMAMASIIGTYMGVTTYANIKSK